MLPRAVWGQGMEAEGLRLRDTLQMERMTRQPVCMLSASRTVGQRPQPELHQLNGGCNQGYVEPLESPGIVWLNHSVVWETHGCVRSGGPTWAVW